MTNNEGKRGVFMWVGKREFAKLLQDNESRICWQSDTLPSCLLVHVWTLEGTGEAILREYWHKGGEVVFWACDELFKG